MATTHHIIILFIVCVFAITNSLSFLDAAAHEVSDGVKLQLIHRHHLSGAAAPPATQLERLRQLLHSDAIRLRYISHRASLKQSNSTSGAIIRRHLNNSKFKGLDASGQVPIHSAAGFGIGQYFVEFRVGSPAQKFVLIVDTGSELTWMNCKFRCLGGSGGGCRRNLHKRPVFWADHSSSFRTIPCSSTTCMNDFRNYLFGLDRCPSPIAPCAYDYRYVDGTDAIGVFGKETVTLGLTNGRKTRLHNVLVGCSINSTGPSVEPVDGVMGLGYSNFSLALKASDQFGGKFSYCLVDHLSPKNISSYLVFGSENNQKIASRMHYTELLLGVINPFYAINIRGISIGGAMLEIPIETWDVKAGGGAILDSGMSLTALMGPAYRPVMDALIASLVDFERLIDVDAGGPLEYCFNSTGFVESVVPKLVFHFGNEARFEPPVKSYVIDDAPGVKCLGFVAVDWPGYTVIGNIMQQNYFWEFDLVNRRLGFGSSSCS